MAGETPPRNDSETVYIGAAYRLMRSPQLSSGHLEIPQEPVEHHCCQGTSPERIHWSEDFG
jgi:hypothetical protein